MMLTRCSRRKNTLESMTEQNNTKIKASMENLIRESLREEIRSELSVEGLVGDQEVIIESIESCMLQTMRRHTGALIIIGRN